MSERLSAVATESIPKRNLAELRGKTVIDDPGLMRRIWFAEEFATFDAIEAVNAQRAPNDQLVDSFLMPYYIPRGRKTRPLPVEMVRAKAQTTQEFIRERPEYQIFDTIEVQDSVWRVESADGRSSTAVNKIDPEESPGAIERLTEFFYDHRGRRIYSVGARAEVDTKTVKYDGVRIGSLRVGEIRKDLTPEHIRDVLSLHLPHYKAIDVKFVLDEFVTPSDTMWMALTTYDLYSDDYVTKGLKRIPIAKATREDVLNGYAHGIDMSSL